MNIFTLDLKAYCSKMHLMLLTTVEFQASVQYHFTYSDIRLLT